MSDQTPEIVWEDPPKRHKRSEWTPFLLAIQERPGQSARAKLFLHGDAAESQGDPSGTASNLAQTMRGAAKVLGNYEVVARSLPTGGAGVWATYIGPLEPAGGGCVAEGPEVATEPVASTHEAPTAASEPPGLADLPEYPEYPDPFRDLTPTEQALLAGTPLGE